MSRFVRASKVRHVYCNTSKNEEHYTDFRLSTATGDHNYIKANARFFAIPVATGGGSLAIWPIDKPGRLPATLPVLDGHKGPVLDFDFHPFRENMIGTGGDDCTIKVWGFSPEGLTKTISDPLVDMNEHMKKVVCVLWHPTANDIIASGSADHLVKIWDITTGDSKVTLDHGDVIQDLAWNFDGSQLATSCKDKNIRLTDPRTNSFSETFMAHEGSKSCKVTYLGEHGNLVTVGFTRQSKRQFKIWDPRKVASPLASVDIDQAAGVLMPFFDAGTNLLYLAGKGDGNVRYYEMVGESPYQFSIADHKTTMPTKGMCLVPTRSLDVMKCEVTRMLKLHSNMVEPLSFVCPRKSDLFQEDLYPDCYAGKAAMTNEDYWNDKNKKPIMMSLDPSKRSDAKGGAAAVDFKAKASRSDLEKHIKYLEGLLSKNNIKHDSI